MLSKKIDEAKYGPNVLEVLFGAVLSLLLGAVLAVSYLALQTVQIGASKPKADTAGAVSFTRGARDGERGKEWQHKKQLFTEGTTVEVNEDELNAWITATTVPEPLPAADAKKPDPAADAKKPGAAAHAPPAAPAPPSAPGGPVQFGAPDFRIVNGVLHIASECELDLDMVGIKRPLIMQASGRFAKNEGKIVFVPDEFYIGCCPVHKLPGVGSFVFGRVLAKMKIPEDIAAAWKKLKDVSIEGDSMRLTMP